MRRCKFVVMLMMVATASYCYAASTYSQQVPAAVVTDPPPDKEFPATVEAPDILSHGARLNAVFYLASGAGAHPTVLLLHGFPGNEKNLDLAYAFRRAGWHVLIPNYRGSWGSGGDFSFSHCIEDTQEAIAFLRDPVNVRKYRIDARRIVLVGHSMGGFMAAYATAHDPDIQGVALIAAWNIGASMARPADPGRMENFMSAPSRLNGTTPGLLLAETKENAAKWDYAAYADALKTRAVLLVEAKDRNTADNQTLAEALRKAGDAQVVEKYMETDHSFSDHRIALQAAVVEWLQSLAALQTK